MQKIITFTSDKIKTINLLDYDSEDYAVANILFFSTRPNAHDISITEDVLKNNANSVLGKWVTADIEYGDCTTHTNSQIIVGIVPKEQDVRFVYAEDGYLDAYVDCVISKRYSKEYYELFSLCDDKRSVSIEAYFEMDNEDNVIGFDIKAITTLGRFVEPSVPDARIKMFRFSETEADKYYRDMVIKMADKKINILNTKEAAVDGAWENPRRKLLKPILEASNRKSLLEEAYLIADLENPTTTNCKYPHHVVRNGNLVIHIGGLKAAFARASQQGIVSGKIKAHLLRHYHELGLSTENFAEFGITEEEFNMYFKEESCGDNKMKNFAIEGREAWGKIIEKIQAHEGKDVYVDSIEKDHIIYTKDDVRYRVDAEIKVGEDDDTIDAEIDWNTVRKDEDQKMSADEKLSVLEKKFADLKIECDKLENANKAYMAQIEAMSDYDKLKQFKLDTEAKEKEEKRMNAMCEIFSELSEKGFAMNDKQKDELTKKFAEFDSIDGFRNYAKAFAFDSLKEDSDKLHKMAYPDNNIHIDDIWDEIRAKGLID